MSIIASEYVKAKAAGKIKLFRYGQQFIAHACRYDQANGNELPPAVVQFSKEQIEQQRATAAADVAGFDALLADMESLPGA